MSDERKVVSEPGGLFSFTDAKGEKRVFASREVAQQVLNKQPKASAKPKAQAEAPEPKAAQSTKRKR
jgi:hypothetical protein